MGLASAGIQSHELSKRKTEMRVLRALTSSRVEDAQSCLIKNFPKVSAFHLP